MTASEEQEVEKKVVSQEATTEATPPAYEGDEAGQTRPLKRDLKGRHMQMIAIGQCTPERPARPRD